MIEEPMQKIEKWRVQELAIVLDHITELLKIGNCREWANVIEHYHKEAQKILSKKEFDIDAIKKLVQNIRHCYKETSFSKNLELWHIKENKNIDLNQEFCQARARLLHIVSEIEMQTVEFIS